MDALDRAKLTELLNLTGGDRTWLADLLGTYVEDTGRRLAELESIHPSAPAEQVRASAHGMKGASGNIGAIEVAHRCHEMEVAASTGDRAQMAAAYRALEVAYARVVDEVPRALAEL